MVFLSLLDLFAFHCTMKVRHYEIIGEEFRFPGMLRRRQQKQATITTRISLKSLNPSPFDIMSTIIPTLQHIQILSNDGKTETKYQEND